MNMNAATAAEMLRQVIEGEDIPSAKAITNLKSDFATAKAKGFPYSISGNLWHCDYWNRLWLARLNGEKGPAKNIWAEDWHDPRPEEWREIKLQFISNLEQALQIASSTPFRHSMKTDSDAIKILIKIATHTAYHVGQSALLKRILRAKEGA